MIHESTPWKEDLLDSINEFNNFINDISFNSLDDYSYDRAFMKVEKFFFHTSFIARKLIESKKITDSLECKKYKVIAFPKKNNCKERLIDVYGWDFDQYNTEKINYKYLKTQDIANSFIHSFVLNFTFDEKDRINGVFVVSNWFKDNYCLHFPLSDYCKIISNIANDHVSQTSIELNNQGNIKLKKS